MLALKVLKLSKIGSLSVLPNVFAIGSLELLRKTRRGRGSKPAGGIHGTPVAKMRTSSRVTAPSFSKYTKYWT